MEIRINLSHKEWKAKMKLTNIDIKNYRSIDTLSLSVRDGVTSVFVGMNESGKSNILKAINLLASKGSLYVSRPTLFTHIATRERTQAMADDLFGMVTSGKVKIAIDQTFPLAEVAEAHRCLEARKTTGCTILTL